MRWPTALPHLPVDCTGEFILTALLMVALMETIRGLACRGHNAGRHVANTGMARQETLFGPNAALARSPGGGYRWDRARGKAFTLVEMIVVLAIVLLLSLLVVPAFNALKGSKDVTTSTYTISGALDQARAYAMGNNTYVFVGIEEVDSGQSSSNVPQNPATKTAGGRVVIAVVASKDGTKQYATIPAQQTPSQGNDWQSNYATSSQPAYQGGQLVALSKLLTFDNLHIAAALTPPASGSMYRPAPDSPPAGSSDIPYDVGDPNCQACIPFAWPLGSALNKGQYNFNKVIQFDPQGVARIPSQNNASQLVQWMEIALLPTHGNLIPANPVTPGVGNQAAIQINGMTGANIIYRP